MIKNLNYNHYVVDIKDASLFDKRQANVRLNKFNHPENWIIVAVKHEK